MSASSAGSIVESGFERILVSVDSSPMSARVAKYVCGLVRPGVEVRIVSVAENSSALVPLGSLADAVFETIREELLRDPARRLSWQNKFLLMRTSTSTPACLKFRG
jgi:hypothetical protein